MLVLSKAHAVEEHSAEWFEVEYTTTLSPRFKWLALSSTIFAALLSVIALREGGRYVGGAGGEATADPEEENLNAARQMVEQAVEAYNGWQAAMFGQDNEGVGDPRYIYKDPCCGFLKKALLLTP